MGGLIILSAILIPTLLFADLEISICLLYNFNCLAWYDRFYR